MFVAACVLGSAVLSNHFWTVIEFSAPFAACIGLIAPYVDYLPIGDGLKKGFKDYQGVLITHLSLCVLKNYAENLSMSNELEAVTKSLCAEAENFDALRVILNAANEALQKAVESEKVSQEKAEYLQKMLDTVVLEQQMQLQQIRSMYDTSFNP